LCYKTADGKNSCAEYCKKPDTVPDSTPGGPDSVVGDFAQGPCQYTGSAFNQNAVNSLFNAAQSGLGINNKFGLAAIIGNAFQESRLNPLAENKRSEGGSDEFGIFQWNPAAGRRQELEKYAADLGLDYKTLDAQTKFFVYEVKNRGYSSLITKLNGATSIEDAVSKFELTYTRAGTPRLGKRVEYAQQAYDGTTC
jgi:hypothetical protein